MIDSPNWSGDGKTVLYLNLPEDKKQLNNVREIVPDANTDKLVAKTSHRAGCVKSIRQDAICQSAPNGTDGGTGGERGRPEVPPCTAAGRTAD